MTEERKYFGFSFLQILAFGIFLLVMTFFYFRQKIDLERNGVAETGTVLEFTPMTINGACSVKIEFYTKDGTRRVSDNVLYEKSNCQIGKKLKIQYSSKSNLVKVFE